MMDYELWELPNGIRVVHRQVTNTKIAHCALMLDIGSRDEGPHQQGIAHFWEHMAFKGTHRRKAFHIINRLESLGGELNAYTTKEKICFYATVLDNHLDKAVELLTDITFNSVFPDTQINKERQVILEEMSMYADSPEDAIQDHFDGLVFKDHQLGNNILGTADSVKSFTQRDFLDFVSENLDTNRMVLSSVGNYSLKKLKKIVEKNLGELASIRSTRKRLQVNGYTPQFDHANRDISQAHVAIGCRAFNIYSDQKVPFFVLNNILGGNAMNSRLNLTLRENHGMVYNIDSSFQAFTDTGLFSIFYATEQTNLDKSLNLVRKEIKKLAEMELGSKQLQTAKNQIMGQLAMSEENNQNFMLMMAKSILDHGMIEGLDVVFEKVDKVSRSQLRQMANEHLNFDDMSILKYLPTVSN
ncbi:MAG: pitrilysin family protein [Reichenbachiella sp.]|uniref:M16 family metallopeptidase n=1 Tax=Reichenbachiella sp. TaxID=2184521 RepID=UPI0032634AA0